MKKHMFEAAMLALACCGASQAQTGGACSCDPNGQAYAAAELPALLDHRMVCASLGSDKWQEWHNGNNGGSLVDYKLGPGDPVDPSSVVGTYAYSGATVKYTYGATTYTYQVCKSGANFTFCGAPFGGLNITNAIVGGGGGLQTCAGLSSTAGTTTRRGK